MENAIAVDEVEAINSRCSKKPGVIYRNREKNSQATIQSTGEFKEKKLTRIEAIFRKMRRLNVLPYL